METLDEHIKRLNEKLQQLVKRYTAIQKENQKLKTELHDLKTASQEKNDYVELLKLRIEVLKAGKGEMSREEKDAFEKRINQYLKEVEKCISLLEE